MDIIQSLEQLSSLNLDQLREQHRLITGEESGSQAREQLLRTLAWGCQARTQGDLSERARQRAGEIARDSDWRVLAGRGSKVKPRRRERNGGRDARLPPAGTVLTREHQGKTITVTVLERGFEYEGRQYGSLSAIAAGITGTRWNGYAFFARSLERGKRGRRK